MTGTVNTIVLVTGLSGAGKTTILHMLEDLGHEAVDNLPLELIEEMAARASTPLAIGVDARTRGFSAATVIHTLERLRLTPGRRVDLVFADAAEDSLLRRYSETRRRHPLAPERRVADGIAAEQALLADLRIAADLLIDTTDLPIPTLRQQIEQHFSRDRDPGLTVSLVSFSYRNGLPKNADLVFDARFLKNPHYDPVLKHLTGKDKNVSAYVESDPDFVNFYQKLQDMLLFLLPRFVQEGKKYLAVAVGCTGGKHRSVCIVEKLSCDLAVSGWHTDVLHRELGRTSGAAEVSDAAHNSPPVQAQEA